MDGVITSEECYWNTAALVVWELLFSRRGLNLPVPPSLPPFEPAPDPGRVAAVRRVIFQNDRVITFFKRRAVNSNWDLAFYTFALQLVLLLKHNLPLIGKGPLKELLAEAFSVEKLPLLINMPGSETSSGRWAPSFGAVLNDWAGEATGAEFGFKLHALLQDDCPHTPLPPEIFTNTSTIWEGVRRVFQEWYFGEAGYQVLYGQSPGTPGKRGLITEEQPLLPVEVIKGTLEELSRRGWTLGVATGRPTNELTPPLEQMGLLKYFDSDSVVTFDVVEEAQHTLVSEDITLSLGKPHPFSLLKAYWGDKMPRHSFFEPPFPEPPNGSCFFVGDAPADLLAARAANVSFVAVLTGHEGAAARDYFQDQSVDNILPDVSHLPSCLASSLF